MPTIPAYCPVSIFDYTNPAASLGGDQGCFVDSGLFPPANVQTRASGEVTVNTPRVIHLGQPFSLSFSGGAMPCTEANASADCFANWVFFLRNPNLTSSPLELKAVSPNPDAACQGDFLGEADAPTSNPFRSTSFSCTAEIVSTVKGYSPGGQWWALGLEAYSVTSDPYADLDIPIEVIGTPAPKAAFEVSDFSGIDPGNFLFTSTSTAPPGETLTYAWDFGDGTTGDGSARSHTYYAPGTYVVKLTVTDDDGDTASVTHDVTVSPPSLTVGIGFPGAHGEVPNPDPGTTLPISITVTTGNGVGDLTGLHFVNDALDMVPDNLTRVVSFPDPAIPLTFSMSPDDTKTFTYQVQAKSIGVVDITSTISGADSAVVPQPVGASDEEVMQIGHALKVTVGAAPNSTIQLDDDDEGKPIPKAFTVVVTVTNPNNAGLANVSLDPIPIFEAINASKEKNPSILRVDASKPSPSLDIGSLAAGASAKVTFPATALDDGEERISWGATGVDPSTGAGVSGVGHDNFDVNPQYLISIELTKDGGGGAITAGDSYGLTVDLQNISNAATVDIDPVNPTLKGNAADGNPYDVDNPPGPISISVPTGDGSAAPLGPCDEPSTGAPATMNQAIYYLPWYGTLGAGDPMNLAANVYTVPGGGASASASYTVTGKATLDDGTTRDLSDKDVLVLSDDGGSGEEGNTASLATPVNDSTPPPPPSSKSTIAWNFTVGAALGAAQWWCSTFQAIGTLAGAAVAQTNPFGANSNSMKALQAVEYGITWYQNLTPDEKSDWLHWAYEDIKSQVKDKASVTYAAVSSAALAWWQQGVNAWYSGNSNALAKWLGEVAGKASLEVASWFVGSVWSRGVVSLEERAKVAQLATEAAAGGTKAATKLPVGVNLLEYGKALIQRVYGLTEAQAEVLSDVAKEEDALIAVRSRNPESIEAESIWGAANKPATIKIKTVDQVDIDLLGYPSTVTVNGVTGSSESLAVFRNPAQSAAYLKAHSAGVDPVLLQAAESRLASRTKEWKEYEDLYAGYEKAGLPVEMNYAANGLGTTEPASGYNLRQFAMQSDGKGTSVLLMNNGGKLVPITGDVDVVAITSTNGTLLSPEARLAIYETLQSADGIGMQHGETLSWLTGKDSQTKLLVDHVGPNAERLLVFDPVGGARTATIDAAHTLFNSPTMSLNGVWFVGAYKTPFAATFQNLVLSLEQFNSTVAPWIGPTSWYLSIPGKTSSPPANGNNNNQVGNCSLQFSTSSGASTLEPNGSGGLNQFVNGSWTPYSPPAGCGASSSGDSSAQIRFGAAQSRAPTPKATSGGVIDLEPQSALTAGVSAGSTSISLIPLSLVDPDVSAASTPWFANGETIVIDPGGTDQEDAQIVSTSPLRLAAPLRFAHSAGEMVSVLAS